MWNLRKPSISNSDTNSDRLSILELTTEFLPCGREWVAVWNGRVYGSREPISIFKYRFSTREIHFASEECYMAHELLKLRQPNSDTNSDQLSIFGADRGVPQKVYKGGYLKRKRVEACDKKSKKFSGCWQNRFVCITLESHGSVDGSTTDAWTPDACCLL